MLVARWITLLFKSSSLLQHTQPSCNFTKHAKGRLWSKSSFDVCLGYMYAKDTEKNNILIRVFALSLRFHWKEGEKNQSSRVQLHTSLTRLQNCIINIPNLLSHPLNSTWIPNIWCYVLLLLTLFLALFLYFLDLISFNST